MTPGRCHRCSRTVLQTWRVESRKAWVCSRCIRELWELAFELPEPVSLADLLRRLGVEPS